MFLRSLEIFGFKSFADRTRIEFAEGITALLGPNGCGKSNVVDAIKWALGEQASRSLRAERMEDVIFNGSENRKPLNVAEVSLTLANEAGLLPLDMPEIQIKRRLYRSGESEYYINSQPAKLKDIRELFWDTGVGKAAYSVMEQGKIDQVLSSKPDERRYLFEEAAGITRYKVRGLEAERRLEKTEDNMRQVDSILGEVKRSYDSLKINADKTLKYRALRETIFQTELDIQLLRLKQFSYEKNRRTEAVTQSTSQRDAIKSEIDGLNRGLDDTMDLVNAMEAQLVERQKLIYGLAVEKNARDQAVKQLIERAYEIDGRIEQNDGRVRSVTVKIEALQDDADEQLTTIAELRKRMLEIDQNIRAFEDSVGTAAARMNNNDQTATQAEADIVAIDSSRAAKERELQIITDDIVTQLDQQLREAGYSTNDQRRNQAELEQSLGLIRTLISGKTALLKDLLDAIQRVQSKAELAVLPELAKIAVAAIEAFNEAAELTQRASDLFEAYKKASPTFIDDFLAPQGIITRKRNLDSRIQADREAVTNKRQLIASLKTANEQLSAKIDDYKQTLEELRVNRARVATQAEAADEQARLIRRELAGEQANLKTIQNELYLDQKRREELAEQITEAESDIAQIDQRGRQLTAELEGLEQHINQHNADVITKRESLKRQTTALGQAQSALEKHHLQLVQIETEIRNIQENFRETHSRDLMEFEDRMFQIEVPAAELRERLATQRSGLRELGSVNLMAVEEFAEVKERYEFLNSQMEDLKKARSDLEQVTAEIRAESAELFLTSYNKIKKNFHNMFRRLFGGGRAELRLSDPNHVLESGIEIYAQPPGKKLENIALLSGGEKSMTAVSLLFATYLVKPSPFCLLDEIDAALDEANVARFVQLLREFSRTSQFIIITHNKKTVISSNTLLGVTMEESGVSKLIAIRLENEAGIALPDDDSSWEDEEVEQEMGLELPLGIDDPESISQQQLRPIRQGGAKLS